MRDNVASRELVGMQAQGAAVAHPEIAILILNLARRAVKRARARVDPRDLANDVFLVLLERESSSAKPIQQPVAYYAAVVWNRLRRLLRTSYRLAEVEQVAQRELLVGDPMPSPEHGLERQQSAQVRLEALRRTLRPGDRAALRLLLDPTMSTRDVAQQLRTSINNVHQIRHRILRQIDLICAGPSVTPDPEKLAAPRSGRTRASIRNRGFDDVQVQ